MSACWQDGDWRAYLDGELPEERMIAGLDHLTRCADCAARHTELASRAARVTEWMGDLERTPAPLAPARPRWKRAVMGLALAAALAAAFVLAQKRTAVVYAPSVERVAPASLGAIVQPPPPAPAVAEPVRRARRIQAARPKAPALKYYLTFDDEPIDTGVVMRVTLASGAQADVIVDSEGRPRAIRAIY